MIEAYYQKGKKISDIATALKRARQTITNVIVFLKEGHSAYDYYERYKANKKRCGRKETQLSHMKSKASFKTIWNRIGASMWSKESIMIFIQSLAT